MSLAIRGVGCILRGDGGAPAVEPRVGLGKRGLGRTAVERDIFGRLLPGHTALLWAPRPGAFAPAFTVPTDCTKGKIHYCALGFFPTWCTPNSEVK